MNKNPNMCTPLTRDACEIQPSCRWSRRKPLSSSSCGLQPIIGRRQSKPSNKCTQLRKKDCDEDDDCAWWRRTKPSFSSCGLNPRRKPNPPILPFLDDENSNGPALDDFDEKHNSMPVSYAPLSDFVIPPIPAAGVAAPAAANKPLQFYDNNLDHQRLYKQYPWLRKNWN